MAEMAVLRAKFNYVMINNHGSAILSLTFNKVGTINELRACQL
jgi:hypothetical protein